MDELAYPLIRRAVASEAWAILPEKLTEILAVLEVRAAGGTIDPATIAAVATPRPAAQRTSTVAVLDLFGTLSKRMGLLAQSSGGTSTEQFTQDFRDAVNDASVGAIVLNVDSPGGATSGIPELANTVYQARGTKPIIAVANGMAASAAYWVASAADEFLVTESGEVGSIGVIAAHEDQSAALEQQGIKISLITAGKYKAENNPFEPMTDEGRAAIQARVDDAYTMFIRAVARNRGTSSEAVRTNFGQGRLVSPTDAIAAGMVDGKGTLDDAIRIAARRAIATSRTGHTAASLDSPMTLAEQSEAALIAAEAFHARVEALIAMRAAEGRRPIGETNAYRIEEHCAAYRRLLADYAVLLGQENPPLPASIPTPPTTGLLIDFLSTEARRLGVPL